MSKVLVMTGGPGVGKTTIVNAILRILAAKDVSLLLCAPTGRAANNVVASTCEFHNVRQDTAGAMPMVCKLWLMPGAELNKLRAKSPTEQCHSG
jgi:molybdopterin-guanine dinucleotide biosynthesis protein